MLCYNICMPRPCKTCQHINRPDIDRKIAAGLPTTQIAREFGINQASLHRHRTNCVGLKSASALMKEASRGTVALASLPSRSELGQAYGSLCSRIDEIVEQARGAGSLAVALQGLNAIRQSLDSLSRLSGHDTVASGEKFTVTINLGEDEKILSIKSV